MLSPTWIPTPVPGQYLINIGSEITVSTASTLPSGITTFTTEEPHGFVVGNKLTVKDTNDAGLADLIITGITTDTVTANAGLGVTLHGPKYLLKNGIASNDLTSDKDGENLGSRGLSFFGNETALLKEDITNLVGATSLKIAVTNSGANPTGRFELGSYIQVDNEIMRITSNALSGSGNDEITVIRGVMGTIKEAHSGGSLIKKIELKAVEFRRPSYLRASGHTFEYLGYGPGNYSTALPQVQVRSLNEEEETLAQAQEKSCGIVVYTGMNNDGDFYIGNKKINSATGKEKTFDIPVPTITGEDPSVNSAVFDEVIIKERLIVEGGNSGTVLSQFDGPVTFNNDVRVNGGFTHDGDLKVTGLVEFTNDTDNTLGDVDTGAFQIDGGAGIAKNLTVGAGLSVGGSIFFDGDIVVSAGSTFKNIQVAVTDDNTIDTSTGNLKLSAATGFGVSIIANTTVTGILSVTDDITAFWSSDERLKNNITPIQDPIAKIMSISGNTFDWNETSGKDGADTGVIAQEIEALGLPGIVTTRDNGYLAVDYHKVVPLLVEASSNLLLKLLNSETINNSKALIMANFRKSFNFRNGVQVDNDNFFVNSNGLVGIGTTIPTEFLDVRGNAVVSGVTSSTNVYIVDGLEVDPAGIATIGSAEIKDINVTGVLTATQFKIGSSDVVDNLIGYARTTFITDNGGVGLHTVSKIGINTTASPGASDPALTVFGNVNVSVGSGGTGIVTATRFDGDIDASKLYTGIIPDARFPASSSSIIWCSINCFKWK